MPTIITDSPFVTAMNVHADVAERITTFARDALEEMLSAKLEERTAWLPVFAEINAAHKATKDNPAKAADISMSDLCTQLGMLGQQNKRPFKVHPSEMAELLRTLDLHDDDSQVLYTLWCSDGQGRDKDGRDLPKRVATYPDYLRWLVERAGVEKELGAKAYTSGGKRTAKHDALIAQRRADADAAARMQLTTIDHAIPRTSRGVEDAHRQLHDLQRALLLCKEEMSADDKARKLWVKGVKDFRAALSV